MQQPKTNRQQRNKATGIGFIAILLWATLALFTALTGKGERAIPPFQLLFLSFFIGAVANTLILAAKKQLDKGVFIVPVKAWLLGVGGLFFYHFFYFNALSLAPKVEASLIAYLWPLLIVLFSALLPTETLRANHIIGACLAFLGAVLLIAFKDKSTGHHLAFNQERFIGYAFAVACALTWSLYSVFNRRFVKLPSKVTVGFCYPVAFLGLLAHLFSETYINPSSTQWLGIVGLGIGPVGISFFVWDYGVKHGNIQILGVLSYFAPLLSTLLLIVFTEANLTTSIMIGCFAIICGAFIAALPKKVKKTG